MNIETLRAHVLSVLKNLPEGIEERALLVTPIFHEYGETDVTDVCLAFQGSGPRARIHIEGMERDWQWRVVRANGRLIPDGGRKRLLCALVDAYLVTCGFRIFHQTPLPINFKSAK